jgi:hypothetical protein
MFKNYGYNYLLGDEDTISLSLKDIGDFNLSSSESDLTEEPCSTVSSSTEITLKTTATSSSSSPSSLSLQTVYLNPNLGFNDDTISTQTPVTFLEVSSYFDSISTSFSSATTIYLNSSSQTDQSTLIYFNDTSSFENDTNKFDEDTISECSSYCSIITIQNSAI